MGEETEKTSLPSGNRQKNASGAEDHQGFRRKMAAFCALPLIALGAGAANPFLNILLLLVFPDLILGALFGQCAGGQSLIKLAFSITRNFRCGSAHAAIVNSAMFGTITGEPLVNVLSTGVLTIPMMLKRSFSRLQCQIS
jgi:TRAP-type mannitol/chloroaromatic compound transport system permease large subunit